jgi:molybdate transport system ATP-binding protein
MSASGKGQLEFAFRGRLGAFALDASFRAPAAGVTAIFGPSGCGKTTVARCIAGLQHLADGFCAIDDDIWQDQATFRLPHQRPIGYVFQEASLFPHLSVRRNLLYGAPPLTGAPIGFDEVADLLGLGGLLDRSPHHLSGGERQRVAIGRALLSQPKLLLMDEPLAALDRATKNEILPFLERLHDQLALPVLYISHDMSEIERFADHLVLMERGSVLGAGPLHIMQSDPALPLAATRDAAVSFDGLVESHDAHYGLLALRVDGGRLLVPAPAAAPGSRQRLRIAASDVSLARKPTVASSILNILPARIVSHSPLGSGEVTVVLALGQDSNQRSNQHSSRDGSGAPILSRVTQRSWDVLDLADGMNIFAQIKGVSLVPVSDRQAIPSAAKPVAPDPAAKSRPPSRHGDCSERTRQRQGAGVTVMEPEFAEIDPNRIAAIVYRPDDDVDTLLAEFAFDLARNGTPIGGIVQRNLRDVTGRKVGMEALDLLSDRPISICQALGSGAMACKLDASGLAEAAMAVNHAISRDVALIVINKFSKQEASGQGLRDEFAEAIMAGVPVLTAVPEKCLDAWNIFTGDRGTTLLCARHVVEGWWEDLSSRMARMREALAAAATGLPTPICRSSHPTT